MMQAARCSALRQIGGGAVWPPIWESLLGARQVRFVQSSPGGPGVFDGRERVTDLVGAGEEAIGDRRGFASAAADDGGDGKLQKGYWRNLVKERLDEELESGTESKAATEASEKAGTSTSADAALEDTAPPADASSSSTTSTKDGAPALPKPAQGIFGDPRRPRPRTPSRAPTGTGSTAWLERLIERQRQLVAQRQQAEQAMRDGAAELEAAEAGLAERNAAETRVAETEVAETKLAEVGIAGANGKSSEVTLGKESTVGHGDQRGATSVAESPGLEAGENEQLQLAKGFAEVEGLGAENVRGLDPEVGLPPLEKPPMVESTSKVTPRVSQKVDGSRISGGVPRSGDDRLSAAAKILGTIRLEEKASQDEGVFPSKAAETTLPVRPVEKSRAGEKASTSERALAAAEVFKTMQQGGREGAAAEGGTAEPAGVPASDELPGRPVSVGDTEAAPGLSIPSSRAGRSIPVKASEAVALSGRATEPLPKTVSPEALAEADGDELESEEPEELSSEQEIIMESAALAHVPAAVRVPLAVAADLQKIPVGLGDDVALPRQDELDMAYVYPEVLTAAEELEWAAEALEELMYAETAPPLPPAPQPVEEEWEEEEEEDWATLSPYERERRRRAVAPQAAPEREPEDRADREYPKRNFEFVAERAHPLNIGFLDNFIDERGNIIPRKKTGLRKKDQTKVERAIKTARQMGLLPVLSDLDWEHPTMMRLYPPAPEDEQEEEDTEEAATPEEEEEIEELVAEKGGDEFVEEFEEDDEFGDFFEWMEAKEVAELPDPESEEFKGLGRVLDADEIGDQEYEIRDVEGVTWPSKDDDTPTEEGEGGESIQSSQ